MVEETTKETKAETKKTDWVKLKAADLDKLVVDLYKQGNSPAKIGLLLRDQQGVPKAKLISKKITKILRDSNVFENSEKEALEKEVASLTSHVAKNKHDVPAKRTLTQKIWSLERIKKASK